MKPEITAIDLKIKDAKARLENHKRHWNEMPSVVAIAKLTQLEAEIRELKGQRNAIISRPVYFDIN